MSFPADRSKWKKARKWPIGWQEAEAIEAKAREAMGCFGQLTKAGQDALAQAHKVSRTTIQKILSARGVRCER